MVVTFSGAVGLRRTHFLRMCHLADVSVQEEINPTGGGETQFYFKNNGNKLVLLNDRIKHKKFYLDPGETFELPIDLDKYFDLEVLTLNNGV